MHRFFVPASRISGRQAVFTDEQQKQLKYVLRMKAGQDVALFDGSGREFVARLEAHGPSSLAAGIVEIREPDVEPPVKLTVMQSLPKGDKVDLVLQKCTELGASEFLIISTERSVPRISAGRLDTRLQRWRTIVKEAAEQSGRVRLPDVDGVIPFRHALARVQNYDKSVIAWEGDNDTTLFSAVGGLSGTSEVAFIIGPEGGFTADEVAAARQAGAVPVSLGKRILRTETAAIVGCAILIHELEDRRT